MAEKEVHNMERTSVQRLAFVLKVLVIILLVCSIAALFFVPGVVWARRVFQDGTLFQAAWEMMTLKPDYSSDFLGASLPGFVYYILAWVFIWFDAHSTVLSLFLWACGICTVVILRQAWRVLNTVMAGNPFCHENAKSMKRTALCCLLIALFALARTVWSLIYYRSAGVLLTYNTFFVPVFLIVGLLCMVISALFRQAAELKEDSDLTI